MFSKFDSVVGETRFISLVSFCVSYVRCLPPLCGRHSLKPPNLISPVERCFSRAKPNLLTSAHCLCGYFYISHIIDHLIRQMGTTAYFCFKPDLALEFKLRDAYEYIDYHPRLSLLCLTKFKIIGNFLSVTAICGLTTQHLTHLFTSESGMFAG